MTFAQSFEVVGNLLLSFLTSIKCTVHSYTYTPLSRFFFDIRKLNLACLVAGSRSLHSTRHLSLLASPRGVLSRECATHPLEHEQGTNKPLHSLLGFVG